MNPWRDEEVVVSGIHEIDEVGLESISSILEPKAMDLETLCVEGNVEEIEFSSDFDIQETVHEIYNTNVKKHKVQKSKNLPIIIIKKLIKSGHIFMNDSIGLYHYVESYGTFEMLKLTEEYEQSFGKFLRNNISTKYVSKLSGGLVKECYFWLRQYEHFSKGMPAVDETLVCLSNGVFNLKNGKLLEHSPKYGFKFFVGAKYVKNATLDIEVENFFMNLGKNKQGHDEILAILGIVLSNYRSLQKILWLYGPSGNGKSTLCNFIQAILPKGSVGGLSLFDFGNDFAPANLAEKHLSICTDSIAGKWSQKSVGVVKQISAGDFLEVQAKCKQHKTVQPTCFLMFVGNFLQKIPRKMDPEGALKRRFYALETGPSIPVERRDTNILDKLLADKDAIVSLALDYTKVFLKNNFWDNVNSENIYEDEILDVDETIEKFIERTLLFTGNSEDKLTIGSLHELFVSYYTCAGGIGEIKRNGFASRIKKYVANGQIKKLNNLSTLIGYKLKEKDMVCNYL